MEKINTNTNPYYDDFDESKNFTQLLFRPGYAVQGRELTQLQSILKNQISRFGNHVFKDGSIVNNGRTTYETGAYYIFDYDATKTYALGDGLLGQTTGAKARVLFVEHNITAGKTFVWYTQTNGKNFSFSESVTIYDASFTANKGTVIFNSTLGYGFGGVFSIEESIFYVSGSFVFVPKSTLHLYEDVSSARLGLSIKQSIISAEDDPSLLDPAQGSYNYAAPGADRYKLWLELDYKPYEEFTDDVDLLATENFIELMKVVNGNVISQVKYSSYSDLEETLARRTYDESGDYTTSAFKANVYAKATSQAESTLASDEITDLVISVLPGKAYVKGKEFETTSVTNLKLPKSREYKSVSGSAAYYSYGNFAYVYNLIGNPDINSKRKVKLYNGATAIGTANITGIEYDSVVSTNDVYRLYLINVAFTSGNFGSVTGVGNGDFGGNFTASISTAKYSASAGTAIPYIINSYDSVAFVTVPNQYVKTLLNAGNSDTIFAGKKAFTVTLTGAGSTTTGTFSNATPNQSFVGSGTLSAALTDADYYVVVTTNSGTGPVPGVVLTYSDGIRINVVSPTQITVTYNNATNFGTGGGNSLTVVAKVSLANWQAKTKLLTTYTHTHATPADTVITLPHVDGYKIININGKDTTPGPLVEHNLNKYYDIDLGQRDDCYDFIKLTKTLALPAGIDSIEITYQYFAHSGSGFFNVDSYTGSGVSFSQIPTYKAANGKSYNLRTVLDFRFDQNSANTYASDVVPVVDSSLSFDYSYYLARKDKLVVTPEKKIKILAGISSENPDYPDHGDAMILYYIDVKPYTFDREDVSLRYVDNRRFTMRDIGKIDQRVSRVEYYAALSLLEKQAAEAKIPSSTPGLDKFKSGILVDPFNNHTVGDTENADYACAIDFEKRELRPRFNQYVRKFEVDSLTGLTRKANLVSLPFTSTEFISQKLASRSQNVNPNNTSSWTGTMTLFPKSDSWTDRETVDFRVTKDQAGAYTSNDGSRWNSWQAEISGIDASAVPTNSTETTTTKTINNKVIDTSPAMYVRPQEVMFISFGHTPDTKMYLNVGGVNISNTSPLIELVFSSNISSSAINNITQGSITGTIVNVHQNRAFVYRNTGSFTTGATTLKINSTTVETNSITEIIISPNLTTNDFGVVAGLVRIEPKLIPAGNVNFVLSDTINGQRAALTSSTAIFPANGIVEKSANITISTLLPIVVKPPIELTPPASVPQMPEATPLPPAKSYDVGVECGYIRCTGFEQATHMRIGAEGNNYWSPYRIYLKTRGAEFQNDTDYDTYTFTVGTLPLSNLVDYYFSLDSSYGATTTPGLYEYVGAGNWQVNSIPLSSGSTFTLRIRKKDAYWYAYNWTGNAWAQGNAITLVDKTSSTTAELFAIRDKIHALASNSISSVMPTISMSCPVDAAVTSVYKAQMALHSPWSSIEGDDLTFEGYFDDNYTKTTSPYPRAATVTYDNLSTGVATAGIPASVAITIEWVPVAGWSGVYSITSDIAPVTFTLNEEKGTAIMSVGSSGWNLTFPDNYNPPELYAGEKHVKKGRLKVTAVDAVNSRTSTALSGVVTFVVRNRYNSY